MEEKNLELLKVELRGVLDREDQECIEPELIVLALVELAVDLSVQVTGGAVEGLSLFLTAASAAPIMAQDSENGDLWIN
jgi:hypothetical protein